MSNSIEVESEEEKPSREKYALNYTGTHYSLLRMTLDVPNGVDNRPKIYRRKSKTKKSNDKIKQ